MGRRPSAPMPTAKQIREANEAVQAVCPGARILRVGPDGVTYTYPGEAANTAAADDWQGRPFSADGA